MIETNANRVFTEFQKLTTKEMKKALRTGLRKALKEIQKDTKENLGKAFKNTNKKNPKYDDTLQKGVRITKIWENEDGSIVGKVRIDSTRKTGSGSFRLVILEGGNFKTSPRLSNTYDGKKLRKPKDSGDLTGGYFFKSAVNSNESTFNSKMGYEVEQAVNKINNANLK